MNAFHRTVVVAALAFIAPASSASATNLLEALFRPLAQQEQQPAFVEPQARQADIRPSGDYRAPEMVRYPGPYKAGTVIVNTAERRLYYVMGADKALRYSVGVGRQGFEWSGAKQITMMQEWPEWRPPAEMIQRRPDLPRFMAGGPTNPLGARALYLGDSLYRIHGSNEPELIGHAVSSGCIRMLNADVIDLYSRVRVGTQVIVMR